MVTQFDMFDGFGVFVVTGTFQVKPSQAVSDGLELPITNLPIRRSSQSNYG